MKVRSDILFIRKGDGGKYSEHKYVDLFDVFLYEDVEHMLIGFGLNDAGRSMLAIRNDGIDRPYVSIPMTYINDKVAEFKADDKLVAYIMHKNYHGYRGVKLFDIATGREPYPKRFETSWNKFDAKRSELKLTI